jgi:F-type H+-transporting ATPase subunit b
MASPTADPTRLPLLFLSFTMAFALAFGFGAYGISDVLHAAPWQEADTASGEEATAEAASPDAQDASVTEEVADEPSGEEAEEPVEAAQDVPAETLIVEPEGIAIPHDDHAGSDAHEDHHDGEHHDPFDLSEGNASSTLLSPADLKFDLAIYTVIVFLLLLAGLYKFAWGPISRGLEKREQGIANKIDEANLAATQAAEKLREYEARLATATEEARTIIQQAHQDAQRSSERILAEAQERADRERLRSVADIEAAKNVALESISQKTVDLAMLLAGRIVRKELNETDHTQLIREALEKLPSQN